MKAKTAIPTTVDQYISMFPESTQKKLKQLRALIVKTAPKAEEYIGYQMPAYKYFGMLVYFAGYKQHIGFYPGAAGIKAFQKEISVYKNAKGSVQFPLDEALPVDLIRRIVKFRVEENEEKNKTKVAPKTKEGLMSLLSAPAARALEGLGIKTEKQLSRYSEAEILDQHGIGPSALPKLRSALKAKGLTFKKS